MTVWMIALVSGQPMPVLLPVLARDPKPDKMFLLSTDKVQGISERLKKLFERENISCEINIVDAFDYDSTLKQVEEICDKARDHHDVELIVNVTAGTKLMSLGAANAAHGKGAKCCYLVHDSGQLLWLGGNKQTEDLRYDCLKVLDILAVHDFKEIREECRLTSEWENFAVKMSTEIQSDVLRELNKITQEAKNKKKYKEVATECRHIMPWLEEAQILGLLGLNGNKLKFKDKCSHGFMAGGWLEVATEVALRNVAAEMGVFDIKRGLSIESSDGIKNELDVVAICNNKLCVIECKTASYGEDSMVKIPDVFYKMDSAKYGGLKTKKLFVSFNALNADNCKRFDKSGIMVLHGGLMRDLEASLKQWLMQ